MTTDYNRYALVQIASIEDAPTTEELEVFEWVAAESAEQAEALAKSWGYGDFGVSTEDEVERLGIVDRS